MRHVLSKLFSALLPAGVYQRDTDGTPLMTINWHGVTSLTPAGIERALTHHARVLAGDRDGLRVVACTGGSGASQP